MGRLPRCTPAFFYPILMSTSSRPGSIRSHSPASWRSKRASTTISVSNVYGTPVNSSPKGTAISSLPASPLRNEISRKASSSSTSDMSVYVKKRDRDSDANSDSESTLDAPSTHAVTDAHKKARLEPSESIAPAVASLPPPVQPVPGPKSAPSTLPEGSDPSSASPRTSWFGSINKKHNLSAISLPNPPVSEPRPEVDRSAPATPMPVDPPPQPVEIASKMQTEPIDPPIPDTPSTPLAPASSAPARSTIASWFAGVPRGRSLSRDRPERSSQASASVIEIAPPPPPLPSPPHGLDPPNGIASASPASQPSASTNSSTPRYTLMMPLLGGSRTRLVDGVPPETKSVHEKVNTPPPISPPAQTQLPQTSDSLSVAQPSSDLQVLPSPASASTIVPPSTSWWSYLGFASATLPPSPNAIPIAAAPDHEDVPHTVPSEPDPPNHDPPTTVQIDHPPIQESSSPQPNPPPPPSIISADSSVTRASWFASLVGWKTQQAISVEPISSGSESGAPDLTQSQRIKEEALARDTVRSAPSQFPTLEPNPILNSATRASWVSFFSAKSRAAIKPLTNGEGDMEVMDIDDAGAVPAPANPSGPVGPHPPSSSLKPTPLVKQNEGPPAPAALPLPPLTDAKQVKKKASEVRKVSTTSKKDVPRLPNLVLPTWGDTFYTVPRVNPPPPIGALQKTINVVTRLWLVPPVPPEIEEYRKERRLRYGDETARVADQARQAATRSVGRNLSRVWSVLEGTPAGHTLTDVKRVVVIGVHGWFPGAIARTLLGEPTGTSKKFADMMEMAVAQYAQKHGMNLEKVTKIPLEGEGSIETRVSKLFRNWQDNLEWVEDLHSADAVFVATHSQGCIASTQLIDLLIREGHINTGLNPMEVSRLCGVHHGPLHWINNSTVFNPYITYFESPAARELFEFQDAESPASIAYRDALRRVLDHGTKMVYVASLNDQVVPIYSASFTAATHPLILRALYMDGDAYSSSDFLSNLIVLLLRIRNAGLDDGGLLADLSLATAGSLSGVGHSSAYEEPATYALAARFLFETSGPLEESSLVLDSFQARAIRNDYHIPWSLRGLIEDSRIATLFSSELAELRSAFDHWQPKTTNLREIRRKLEPIRQSPRLSTANANPGVVGNGVDDSQPQQRQTAVGSKL
ncbi:hypothetical protein BS47DRAFT_1486796 [Hydnum rufescens UP504]|uniref:YMC020W-like alpha/beta hydrolase domain-containing protein n=1 Tax=Hydnum rufescens UP504 TaxID=1448309 RepID=A0A9P6AU65_9AGAM|nr:hypothetical protein BS47DRAFT_1486796 [Hydnum rufescens UP504]